MSGPSQGFASFIASLRLRHFTADELVTPEHSSEPWPTLWHNGVGVLVIADAARRELGFPLQVLSAHRDPERNKSAGGGLLSRHQLFEALDLRPAGESGSQLFAGRIVRLHRLLNHWRHEGRLFVLPVVMTVETTVALDGHTDLRRGACWRWKSVTLDRPGDQPRAVFRFKGGLGLYSWGVHVDTRGTNATWSGS